MATEQNNLRVPIVPAGELTSTLAQEMRTDTTIAAIHLQGFMDDAIDTDEGTLTIGDDVNPEVILPESHPHVANVLDAFSTDDGNYGALQRIKIARGLATSNTAPVGETVGSKIQRDTLPHVRILSVLRGGMKRKMYREPRFEIQTYLSTQLLSFSEYQSPISTTIEAGDAIVYFAGHRHHPDVTPTYHSTVADPNYTPRKPSGVPIDANWTVATTYRFIDAWMASELNR